MDLDDQLTLGPLFLSERKCRVCGETKNLIDGFYKTRPGQNYSAYSYECKSCTVKRVTESRKSRDTQVDWSYPDW